MSSNSNVGTSAVANGFPPVPDGRSAADLAQFWVHYEPIVARAAGSRLRRFNIPDSLASVDDVTQEVYLHVAEHWPTVQHPGRYALGCSLRTVVGRLHRERLRRLGILVDDPHQDRLDQTADVTAPGTEDRVLDEIVDTQLCEALPAAWQQLSPKEQDAVELTVLEGTSRGKAAEAMGVAIGTVSSHRARGVVKLRGALAPIAGVAAFALAVEQLGFAAVVVIVAMVLGVLLAVAATLSDERRTVSRTHQAMFRISGAAPVITLFSQGPQPIDGVHGSFALITTVAYLFVLIVATRTKR